ncbi:MAG TPA: hypothetical protein VF789_33735 [Thermoanaerobaculia bacterium]
MVSGKRRSEPLILDACCLINLLASGRTEEIFRVLPYQFATSRLIATEEILAIAQIDAEGVPIGREVIVPSVLEGLENLSLLDLVTTQEMEDFLLLAKELGRGESSILALALSHRGVVATDDRKALKVLARRAPHVSTMQTPELLYEWAQLSQAQDDVIREVLQRIRFRGRFHPNRDAPRFDWWVGYL